MITYETVVEAVNQVNEKLKRVPNWHMVLRVQRPCMDEYAWSVALFSNNRNIGNVAHYAHTQHLNEIPSIEGMIAGVLIYHISESKNSGGDFLITVGSTWAQCREGVYIVYDSNMRGAKAKYQGDSLDIAVDKITNMIYREFVCMK